MLEPLLDNISIMSANRAAMTWLILGSAYAAVSCEWWNCCHQLGALTEVCGEGLQWGRACGEVEQRLACLRIQSCGKGQTFSTLVLNVPGTGHNSFSWLPLLEKKCSCVPEWEVWLHLHCLHILFAIFNTGSSIFYPSKAVWYSIMI